jgi:hypothetical protein
MKTLLKLGPLKVFLIAFLIISIPLFIFPINLFSGIIVFGKLGVEKEVPLSLSYFLGLGYEPNDLKSLGITDFYLTGKGKMIAFIFLIGIPSLLAYSAYLFQKK